MRHLRLLLLPLAVLLLSGPAHAEPSLPGADAPPSLTQGKRKAQPPVKDEDGNEIDLPKYSDEGMQCVVKCQETVGRCVSKCQQGDRRCNAKCAQTMERCTQKCDLKTE